MQKLAGNIYSLTEVWNAVRLYVVIQHWSVLTYEM